MEDDVSTARESVMSVDTKHGITVQEVNNFVDRDSKNANQTRAETPESGVCSSEPENCSSEPEADMTSALLSLSKDKLNASRNSLRESSDTETLGNKSEDDTLASRIDIAKINSIRAKQTTRRKSDRKESFEQRLKRTFTIKDSHTNEVTKRIMALLIKYSLFVFNFVSWIIAIGAIVSGIWMRGDKTLTVTTDTGFFMSPPTMTCVGGGVTFVVAFLGCVGALRENLILLKVFFYVLTFILLGEMMLGAAVFVLYLVPEARENFLRSQPEKILRSAIKHYMDDAATKAWVDNIQSEFKCCGISQTDEGFRDWQSSPYFNCTPSNRSIYRCAVPMSCCIIEKGDRVNTMCGFNFTNKTVLEVRDYIFVRGCMHGFGEWLGKYDDLIIIACISICIMQFLAVLSAKLMVIRIQKQRSRWQLLLTRRSQSSVTATEDPEVFTDDQSHVTEHIGHIEAECKSDTSTVDAVQTL